MTETGTTTNFNVEVNVKAVNYQTGNVMQSSGKLKTVFGGKGQIANEEALTFRGGDCGKSTMDIDYNSSLVGEGAKASDVSLDMKASVLNEKKEFVDVASATSSFSKTETIVEGHKSEDWLKLHADTSCDAKCASTDSYYTHKDTKVVS